LNQTGASTLVEALAAWGEHEANGRLRGQVQIASNDRAAFADLTLRYRAPFVTHLLSHYPTDAVMIDFEPRDADAIFLADGRKLSDWSTGASQESLAHYKTLCESASPPLGPLVAAIHASGQGPFVRYDGWHRAAAWRQRCSSGRGSNISAHLILCARF
jgi:hypothetical protein